MTEDVEICESCVVRKPEPFSRPVRRWEWFEIRVGDPGWHRNAALLNKEQAIRLRRELDLFIEQAP